MFPIQTHGRLTRGGPHASHRIARGPRPRSPQSLTALLLTAACGDVEGHLRLRPRATPTRTRRASPDPSADVDTSAAEGNWLLGMQTAGGADGETSTTVYITYNPVDRAGHGTQDARRHRPPAPRSERGRAAGQRRPQVGDPRHRDLATTRRTPASSRSTRWPPAPRKVIDIRQRHRRRQPQARSAGPSTPSAPTRCGSSTPPTGSGRSTSPAARPPRRARWPRARGCSPTASTTTPASPTWRASTATRPTRPATARPTPPR